MNAYRSYIETLLTYSSEAKSNQLAAGLYYHDSGDDLDYLEDHICKDTADAIEATKNIGLKRRFS